MEWHILQIMTWFRNAINAINTDKTILFVKIIKNLFHVYCAL